MTNSAIKKNALSVTAFATLLLIALLMGANHIAARIAFNNGVDVATAVTARSLMTAFAVSLLVYIKKVPLTFTNRHKKILPIIGVLITVQSLTLYSAVARLPVSLALLVFNTYPLWAALWANIFYKHRPEKSTLIAMPIMLFGLALALDVLGASSGLGVKGQWSIIGAGVAFALTAAATFGMALVLIQHEAHALDSRLRTTATFWIAGILACIGTQVMGEFHWPDAIAGWWGLAALIALYGSGITMMFTVLPKLGVVGNSAIMNMEPIFALILAWVILGQAVSLVQIVGALIVVGTVIKLGLRKN